MLLNQKDNIHESHHDHDTENTSFLPSSKKQKTCSVVWWWIGCRLILLHILKYIYITHYLKLYILLAASSWSPWSAQAYPPPLIFTLSFQLDLFGILPRDQKFLPGRAPSVPFFIALLISQLNIFISTKPFRDKHMCTSFPPFSYY